MLFSYCGKWTQLRTRTESVQQTYRFLITISFLSRPVQYSVWAILTVGTIWIYHHLIGYITLPCYHWIFWIYHHLIIITLTLSLHSELCKIVQKQNSSPILTAWKCNQLALSRKCQKCEFFIQILHKDFAQIQNFSKGDTLLGWLFDFSSKGPLSNLDEIGLLCWLFALFHQIRSDFRHLSDCNWLSASRLPPSCKTNCSFSKWVFFTQVVKETVFFLNTLCLPNL